MKPLSQDEISYMEDYPELLSIKLPSCPKCNDRMTWCSEFVDEKFSDLPVGCTEDVIQFDQNLLPIICFDCEMFTCVCRKCGNDGQKQPCRFISKTKVNKNDGPCSEWFKWDTTCTCEDCCNGDIKENEISIYPYCKNRFYFDDQDIYFIDLNEHNCLTGPDGGIGHVWRCDECKKYQNVSDK